MTTRLTMVLAMEAGVLACLLTVSVDQYAHRRVQHLGGVNTWGYRGSVALAKRPGEFRMVMAGGSQAFGWGVAPAETAIAYLRTLIEGEWIKSGTDRTVTAFNLGALGLPAHGYASRIERFRYLEPDVICLFVDLVDSLPFAVMPPAESGVTALTGYVPMLPIVLAEQGWQVGNAMQTADRALYRVVGGPAPSRADRRQMVHRAIDAALQGASFAVVVLPAPAGTAQRAEHEALMASIASRAAADQRLQLVDLSAQPLLRADDLRLDGVNFGAAGHSLVANEIATAVAALIRREAA